MRYRQIRPPSQLNLLERNLFEINMSPKSLEKLAAAIDARAGLEFEMIVPNAENNDNDDYESEPDYDSDEHCSDIDDAVRFFHDGDFNSRGDVDHLRRAMMSDYEDWYLDKLGDRWDSDGEDYLRDWIESNVSEDEWNDPDIGGPELDSDSRLDIFAADAWKNRGNYYDSAREEFDQEHGDDFGQSEWLDDQGMNMMSNIEENYNITWPHWTSSYNGGSRTTAEVADSFDNYLGRGVKVGGYHGVDRNTKSYIVEPDGSLEPDDSDDAGLEFVSPPLSIPEMIEDLKKVAAWAKAEGCYTNNSTGLHMNISVENFDKENIDYIKLAVLCGDEYVLKEFGRMSNTYAASAIGKVKNLIRDNPDRAAEVLAKMKSHLEQGADRAVESTTRNIHGNYTNKYTSINLKDNRIEFRSPGGDWLGEYRRDPGKLVNTMLRFVVALDAAMDPDKYRKEYLTKLYKLLNPKGQKDEYGEMIEQFAKYVTGVGGAPEQVVKNFRRLATDALQQSKKSISNQYYEWQVFGNPESPYQSKGITIVAKTAEEAMEKAAKEWNLNTISRYGNSETYFKENRWHAEKVRPVATPVGPAQPQAAEPDNPNFAGIRSSLDRTQFQRDAYGNVLRFPSTMAALDYIHRNRLPQPEWRISDLNMVEPELLRRIPPQTAAQQADAQVQRHYEVFDREDPEQDSIAVIHGTDAEIAAMLENLAARRNVPRTRLGIRNIGHTATGANAGAAQPQQPRQATAPNGVPLWEVYERDSGHVVYTFPDHNQQSAWSTAQAWLRAHAEPAAASGFSCRPKMETN